jgi:hypothetical protein
MTIKLHTSIGRNGLDSNSNSVETFAATRSDRTADLFPSVDRPLPVRLDIDGGARAGSRLVGPPQGNHAPSGCDVVLCVNASGQLARRPGGEWVSVATLLNHVKTRKD